MTERWKPIDGWPGYEVSDHGRVRSCKWPGGKNRQYLIDPTRGWRILRPGPRNGYLSVILADHERRHQESVNVLVLKMFVGPRPEGHHAAHNDGNKHNNALDNLRWATPPDNNADKWKHGTQQCGERGPAAKLTEAEVARIRELHGLMSGAQVAQLYGVHENSIYNIWNRKTWGHAG